jgi:hypothetical protein
VPKKLLRELVVDLGMADPDIANREAGDTVKAVNTVSKSLGASGTGAIAARKLQKSGNVVITFEEEEWVWFADDKNHAWVRLAFGATAELKRRTFAVLAKGVRPAALNDFGGNENGMDRLGAVLSEQNKVRIARVRARTPRRSVEDGGNPRSIQLLIEVHTVEEAIRLIDRGVLLNYALHPCERFEGAARALICFNCGKWGHKAAFCKEEKARCLICACEAHGQGGTARERETRCPVKVDRTRKPKCINCGGAHAAFDESCRVAREHRQRARERFLDRPLTFQAPPSRAAAVAQSGRGQAPEASQIRATTEERPRKRPARAGRPSNVERAGQANGANLFKFFASVPATLTPPAATQGQGNGSAATSPPAATAPPAGEPTTAETLDTGSTSEESSAEEQL